MNSIIFISPNQLKPSPPSLRQLREINLLLDNNIYPIFIETLWLDQFEIRKMIKVNEDKIYIKNRVFPCFTINLFTLKVFNSKSYKIIDYIKFMISITIYVVLLTYLILKLSKIYRTSILLASNAPDIAAVACAISKFLTFSKIKFLYEFRELTPELYSIRSQSSRLYYWLSIFERIAARASLCAIVVSRSMAITLKYKHKIPDTKIIVIYSSPTQEEIVKMNHIRTSLSQNEKSSKNIVLLYGGNYLKNIHDLELLIQALNKLIYEYNYKNITLYIVGKGDTQYISYLLSLIKSLKLENHVYLVNWLDRTVYHKLLLHSDICVLPLKRNILTAVSSPNKMFEYLFMGKPVLAPALPSICEIIIEGHNGLLYVPEDLSSLSFTLLNFVIDPQKLEKLNLNVNYYLMKNATKLKFDTQFRPILDIILKHR